MDLLGGPGLGGDVGLRALNPALDFLWGERVEGRLCSGFASLERDERPHLGHGREDERQDGEFVEPVALIEGEV